jgi:hypothetical protein
MLSDLKGKDRLAISFRGISIIAHPITVSLILSILTFVPNSKLDL